MSLARRSTIVKRVKNATKKYFAETTLHGFRYVTHPQSSKFKSIFWSLVCFISVALCIILIHSQYSSYCSNRITTSISTTAFPIWEVPFPAVTLCNFNAVYQSNIEQFRPLLLKKGISANEMDGFFSNLSSLISNNWHNDISPGNSDDYATMVEALTEAGYNTEILMKRLAQPCGQLVTSCYWNLKESNCDQLFKLIKTSRGFCCSFNYQTLYNPQEQVYVAGVGPSFGLKVLLDPEIDQYTSPYKKSYGVEVAIHENIQYPDFSAYASTINPGNSLSLSVKPEITESEPEIRQMEATSRGCAFEDEVPATWATSYSYSTCINECKAKALMELCSCVPFYYPTKIDRGDVRFCTYTDLACLKGINNDFGYFPFQDASINKKVVGDTKSCQCLPQCNEVIYSYQSNQQPNENKNTSVLRVYFGHASCLKINRSIVITWQLAIASVGGLIGLCLGGSILSVIEFFYHILEALFTKYPASTAKKCPRLVKTLHTPKVYWNEFGVNLKEN